MARKIDLRALLWLLMVGLVAACGSAPPTPGSFVGSWERARSKTRSIVSIWEEQGVLHFCWGVEGLSSGVEIRCSDSGGTEQIVRDAPFYAYDTSVRRGASDGELFVEVRGRPIVPGTSPIRWVDRLEMLDDGLRFHSWQVELNGAPREPPSGPFEFVKISDDPFRAR